MSGASTLRSSRLRELEWMAREAGQPGAWWHSSWRVGWWDCVGVAVACRVRGSEQSQLINIPWNGRRVTIVVSMDPVEEITRVGQSKGIKRRNNAVGFRSGGPKSIFFCACKTWGLQKWFQLQLCQNYSCVISPHVLPCQKIKRFKCVTIHTRYLN